VTIARRGDRESLRAIVAEWRAKGQRIGLVPTMGALHAGHMHLVEASRRAVERTIVTIFVNPTQFAPSEDFDAYPRDLEADCARVAAAGGDLVYAPALPAMYPAGFATTVEVAGAAAAGLEDRFRPGHFAGVATIVAKLLLQAGPDVAFFGEKDFQQLRVIERMVADLDIPVEVRGVPTVRERDGLAMSSRNVYLGRRERETAPLLHETLRRAARDIARGLPADISLLAANRALAAAGFEVDYVEVRRARDLGPFAPGEPGRILAAARLGRTRLIDNVELETGTANIAATYD
jgi:pantoate--beta-alanine ligase